MTSLDTKGNETDHEYNQDMLLGIIFLVVAG